jgi:hypothetical protein
MRQSGGRVAGVFRKKSVGASKETRRSGFLMLIYRQRLRCFALLLIG